MLLKVPFEYLNPLCFSLEEISLEHCRPSSALEDDDCVYHHSKANHALNAFALLHLPKLKILEVINRGSGEVSTVDPIEPIKMILDMKDIKRTKKYNRMWKKYVGMLL